MSDDVILKMVFPNRAAACAVASALSGVDDVENLPADGWLTQTVDGVEMTGYYNIMDVGPWPATYSFDEATDTVTLIAPAPPGYRVLGWWHGPGPCPEILLSYCVDDIGVTY